MTRLPLDGLGVTVTATDPATAHASRLLGALGATIATDEATSRAVVLEAGGETVSLDVAAGVVSDWATSGALWLTGRRDGPPLLPPGGAASAARGATLCLALLGALGGRRVELDGHRLLGEYAAARGLARRAPFSANGTTCIVPSADGHLAVSLARPDDLAGLAALVAPDRIGEPWDTVRRWAARLTAAEAAERAQLFGIAAAAVSRATVFDPQAAARGQGECVEPYLIDGEVARPRGWVGPGRPSFRRRSFAPLVVDLSSLWAGPLCANLLALAGARVVKVEGSRRPDGARSGPPAFFDLLHAGHESVALDFTDATDQDRLRRLVGMADVVIEASRPRAMEHLGIDPTEVVGRRPDTTWLSITAYGRTGPWANRVGFGDDTALSAGLVATDPASGAPAPCGDAIADPLTGMHAAVAAIASVIGGGSRVIDVALRDVAASTRTRVAEPAHVESAGDGWVVHVADEVVPVEPPAIRPCTQRAPVLGEHTAAVLAEFSIQ